MWGKINATVEIGILTNQSKIVSLMNYDIAYYQEHCLDNWFLQI